MKYQLVWFAGLACLGLSPLSLGGCCFGGTTERLEIDMPEVTPEADPSLEALWLCLPEAAVDSYCPTTTETFPSDTFTIATGFQTRDLQRFVRPGTILVMEGVGPNRTELWRLPMPTHVTDLSPPLPGEFSVWSTSIELIAPPAGWPVAVPLTIELLDAEGVSAATATVTFTGEQTPRVPLRPSDSLDVCVERSDDGDDSSLFCRETPTPITLGPEHLYVSYSSRDPEVFGDQSQVILERYVRRRWTRAGRFAFDPIELASPEDLGTLTVSMDFRSRLFAETPRWRVRLEVNGREVTAREFEVVAAPEGDGAEAHE